MRNVVLGVAVVLAVPTVAAIAADVAPPPRELTHDPRRPARMESHRKDTDPVLRDLARGHIKAGDDIEALVRLNPHYRVLRFGDYVVMEYDPTGYGGTLVVAKGGKVGWARTSSCIYCDEFIRDLAAEEWDAFSNGYSAAQRQRLDTFLTLPAATGAPATLGFWKRPALAR